MNRFVAVMMLIVGSAMAADHHQHQSTAGTGNMTPQFADARDFVGSPEVVSSSGWDTAATYQREFEHTLGHGAL